jgi:RimJ/RimL family protein N-acetyltransferase
MDIALTRLTSERLILKEVKIIDIDDIHCLHSLSETDLYNTLGIPENKEATQNLVKSWVKEQSSIPRNLYVFRIELKQSQQFVGLAGLIPGKSNFKNAEVWYKTHVDQWNKGYSTEAFLTILKFCFNDLNLHRIEAGCAVNNAASIRVLEKAGMIREGLKRKNLPIRGEWQDSYLYAILEEEFKR